MKSLTHEINFSRLIIFCFVIIALSFTACSSIDIEAEIEPNHTTERIDFNIIGDINSEIHTENDDLATYSPRPEPIMNYGEHLVRITIDDNSFIDLTLYQKYFTDPLQELFQYGAFARNELNSKPAYIVADYYINGQRTYCSAPEHLENSAQYNVFRVNEKNNHYLVRVDNLRLYNVVSKGKTEDEKFVEFYGTFTLLK